ncbi:MAG: SapC family protein, partial [Saezia sp.]
FNLEPLTYDRYWRFAILPSNLDYEFCSQMETAPIQLREFEQVQNNYPIIFFEDGSDFAPHAVLSLLPKVNLALRNNAEWRKELYIPEEFRAYPFGIIDITEQHRNSKDFSDSFSLSLNAAEATSLLGIAPRNPMLISTQESNPLAHNLFLSDGSVTPYVTSVIKAQTDRKQEQIKTEAFCAALAAHGMLLKRSITLRFKDETQITLDGFYTASKTAFSKISSHTLERWKEQGYLELLEQHWDSLTKWNILMMLHERHLNRAIRNLRKPQKN